MAVDEIKNIKCGSKSKAVSDMYKGLTCECHVTIESMIRWQ